jgi:sphingosine kinase
MARSLLHAAGEPFSISNAVFAIIRGHYFVLIFCHLSSSSHIIPLHYLAHLYVSTIADEASIYYTGHKRALDVTSVVQGKTRFFSVLMLTWGMQHVISVLTL